MAQVVAVAYYTLRELSRRKLLIFLVAGGAALVILAAILAAVVRANAPAGSLPTNDFSGLLLLQVAGLVSLFAWIAAVAIAVTLINHDLESGSVVSIFSKPVSRLQYALGKLIAAALALLLIVLVLGVGTQLLVLTNGGGHEGALLKTLALITANELTQMLIILVLTVLMNNIVAAGIGIIIMQLIKVVGTVHALLQLATDQGARNLDGYSAGVNVLYWVIPRYLDSDLTRDVFQAGAGTRANLSLGIVNVSGPVDVAYWVAYLALLFGLLFLALKRREV